MSNQISPLNYFTTNIENWDDIPKAIEFNNDVKKAIDNINIGYKTINVSEAIKKLEIVGDLLKVANAASKGFPCSVPIISILSDYQSLVNDTVNTTSKFVYFSIAVLNQHSLALRVAERYPQKALDLICKTSAKAKEMADICQNLVNMANSLVDKSSDALKLATNDQVITADKEKENKKDQDRLNAKAAKLQSEIESLNDQVKELKELSEDARGDASEKRKFSAIMQTISAVARPLSLLAGPVGIVSYSISTILLAIQSSDCQSDSGQTGLNDAASKITESKEKHEKELEVKKIELEMKKEELMKIDAESDSPEMTLKKQKLINEIKEIEDCIKTLDSALLKVLQDISNEYKERASKSEDKEAEYRKLKNQYQDLQRKANSDLAENLVKLKSLSAEENYLAVSFKSLELTISTMGKVRTIFENTRLFWLQVQTQCQNLIDISNIENLSELCFDNKEFQIDYMNQIKKSGFNWLALSKINYDAANAIICVKKNFDSIMTNLPGKEEALLIVQECTGEIKKILEEENEKITEIQLQMDGSKSVNPLTSA